ncbi:AraC family transcriptional regulator [Paenibacillus doosanensis]|nr:AraC family transcriptional regulator [Paenibacillus doosanensis]
MKANVILMQHVEGERMFTLKDESFYIDYLRFRIRWIRSMPKTAGYEVKPMRMPYTLFWLVMSGTMDVMIEGERRQAAAGDLIVFRPNTLFGLPPQADCQPSLRYLSLCADLKIGNLDLVTLYRLPVVTFVAFAGDLERFVSMWSACLEAFDRLGELMTGTEPAEDGAAVPRHTHLVRTDISIRFLGLQGLLYQWLQQFLTIVSDRLPADPLRLEERVMQACGYVQHRLGGALSLRELADSVHLSPSHLSHLFLQNLGMPPMEYVRQTRLQKAKTLLIDSGCTIKEIADQVGFGEQSQLSRAFRQAEGMSPLQYRQAFQNASIL